MLFKKEEASTEEKFIGRYQQAIIVKKILGKELTEIDLQIAKNKDNGERNEIIERLSEVEDYAQSDFFTNQIDVQGAYKDIVKIIKDGFANCVLQNDVNIENRCFKI